MLSGAELLPVSVLPTAGLVPALESSVCCVIVQSAGCVTTAIMCTLITHYLWFAGSACSTLSGYMYMHVHMQ